MNLQYNLKKLTVFLLFCVLLLSSCNSKQSKIDSISRKIELAESNLDDFNEKKLKSLENDMQVLRDDFVKNKESYSPEQRKEIAKLKGRFTALQIKKGINDFKKGILDFGNEIEGMIEGMN
jgi:hypothetical protein